MMSHQKSETFAGGLQGMNETKLPVNRKHQSVFAVQRQTVPLANMACLPF
jgi:hypothetical protein